MKKRATVAIKVARRVKRGTRARIQVRVRVRGVAHPRGTVTVRLGRKVIKRVRLRAGKRGIVVVRTARLRKRGRQVVRVTYSGTAKIRRASRRTTFRVV